MNEPLENKSNRTIHAVDLHWKGLYRLSGILLIITAVVWTVVTWTARRLYGPGYPGDPAAYLQLISQHQFLASATWSLWIISDFLLFAPTVALYLFLRRYNRTLALLGSMFAMFFNIYDVCVTELNSLMLVSLAHGYAGATSEALRGSFVAAATYGYYGLPLQTVISFATGTFGYLLWCVPMLKSFFRRGTAIFGMIVMVIALIGSASPLFPASVILWLCQFICVPACALWFVLVGLQLYRYGGCIPANVENTASAS
ncbi:MAG: DUF4386 family protein [Anaerolineales bacterium]|jgi:hypothetical protein